MLLQSATDFIRFRSTKCNFTQPFINLFRRGSLLTAGVFAEAFRTAIGIRFVPLPWLIRMLLRPPSKYLLIEPEVVTYMSSIQY
jgi:hypothetical protein